MFGQEVQETARNWRAQEQLTAAAKSVRDIAEKLKRAEDQAADVEHIEKVEAPVGWDWASSYQRFAAWEDVDDLREKKTSEEARLKTVMERQTNPGHYHDHTEERKLFDLPEEAKMALCERHRLLGNALFEEGCVHKAAESYRLALSYYEYCFPESLEHQKLLDSVRYASFCNISLCYRLMGHLRLAIEAANKALAQLGDASSNYNGTKAFFRRAQAHCDLDEYASAHSDLLAALAIIPNDHVLQRELESVARIKSRSTQADQRMAQSMFRTQPNPSTRGDGISELDSLHDFSITQLGSSSSGGSSSSSNSNSNSSSSTCRAITTGKLVWGDLTVPLEPWY